MDRKHSLEQLKERKKWDVAIIGGGATGLGIAVDAATRGYSVLLLERGDFGKGTSSRSTKLIHGGVRYLRQGNLSLVRESLRERSCLLRNAPHLVTQCEFLVPAYAWWETAYYGVGLKAYGLLAGREGLGATQVISRDAALLRAPTLVRRGLRGGVSYFDAQFDDARMLISLARTAADHGACLINYAPVVALQAGTSGRLEGLTMRDELSGTEHSVAAACIVNATGPFADSVRRMDDPRQPPIIAPSQGVHLVLPRRFLPGTTAVMVPRTSDGRILFAIPWQGHVVVGTTDTPIPESTPEPRPLAGEIDFLLETSARVLDPPPTRADILSVFAGIRPLVRQSRPTSTAAISREHLLETSRSGLLTITGGKWTTYRQMAEEAVNEVCKSAHLPRRVCETRQLRLHGFHENAEQFGELALYGADAPALRELSIKHPEWGEPLHPDLNITGARIVWGARQEMAQNLEDVLARRTRALFLNARAALQIAPAAARILAQELGHDSHWVDAQLAHFGALAADYLPPAE
jgi:glycerol-3-phosphate dehydrogenase